MLLKIQSELKAPKNRKNTFGKYDYRSCEDILEAVKPLLVKYNATLTITDDILNVGERYYVRAIAEFTCGEEHHTVIGFARESFERKGMDDAQLTGATSSYARKYALNGLFLIDDSQDSDMTSKDIGSVLEEISQSETQDELKSIWLSNQNLASNKDFLKALKDKKALLK